MRGRHLAKNYVMLDGRLRSRWYSVFGGRSEFLRVLESLESSRDSEVPPDEIVMISLVPISESIGDPRDVEILSTLLCRFSRTCLYVCEVDSVGKARGLRQLLLAEDEQPRLGDHLVDVCVDLCDVVASIDVSSAIISAPHGYCFRKASKNYSSHFIRADRALHEAGAIELCAIAVLAKVSSKILSGFRIRKIFVDTSGILPVAYAIRELLRGAGELPEIVNFKSYEGLSWLEYESLDDSLILISASTSSNMHRRVLSIIEQKSACAEVVTIIGVDGATEDAVFLVEGPLGFWSSDVPRPGLRIIELVGEAFFPVLNWETQVVTLCRRHWEKYWSDDSLYQSIHGEYIDRGTLSLRNQDRLGVVRDVYVDGGVLCNLSSVRAWFENHVLRCVAHDISVIVYFSGDGSESLARLAAGKIASTSVQVVEADGLEGLGEISGSVLVIAGVCSKGSRLLSISRALRAQQPAGHRVYAVAALVPERMSEANSLRQNLTKAPDHFPPYEFRAFRVTPKGRDSASWWEDEAAVLGRLEDLGDLSPESVEFLKVRGSAIENDLSKDNCYFVDLRGRALELTQEFAPWGGSALSGSKYQADVLFTIKCLLQYAREGGIASDLKLHNSALVQGVLSPGNLARYNDGLIQSALLAAAEHAELDYSSKESLSEMFVAIVDDLLKTPESSRSDGLYSILIALASRKVLLSGAAQAGLDDKADMMPVGLARDLLRLCKGDRGVAS